MTFFIELAAGSTRTKPAPLTAERVFAGSVALASNSIFIAQVLGAEAVTQYSVPERLFNLITLITAMVLAPLWPAYGEASARGDHVWVKRTLIRSLFTGVGFAALVASILLFAGPSIIRLWVGDAITPSFLLLLGACALEGNRNRWHRGCDASKWPQRDAVPIGYRNLGSDQCRASKNCPAKRDGCLGRRIGHNYPLYGVFGVADVYILSAGSGSSGNCSSSASIRQIGLIV
jgi:hypothetical protein